MRYPPQYRQLTDAFTIKKDGMDVKAYALVAELIKGRTLDEILRESNQTNMRPFSLARGAEIAFQINRFNTQILHKAGYTDKDPQPKNYFVQEDVRERIRKVDFDQRETLDIASLKKEFEYFLGLTAKLLTATTLPIDLKSGVIDFSALNANKAFGRRFTKSLLESTYMGYIRTSTIEEMQQVYETFTDRLQIPTIIAALSNDNANQLLNSTISKMAKEEYSKDDELLIAAVLDIAEEKNLEIVISTDVEDGMIGVLGEQVNQDADKKMIVDKFLQKAKERTKAFIAIENGVRQINALGYSEGRQQINESLAEAEEVDPFNITFRRFASLKAIEGSKDQWKMGAKVASRLALGKIDEALEEFEKNTMRATVNSTSTGLNEEVPLVNAPGPLKNLYYETRIRQSLIQLDHLNKAGELLQANEHLKIIKLCLKQIPDSSYRAALINSLPELGEQALQLQLGDIEGKMAKGDSMDTLRQQNVALKQQVKEQQKLLEDKDKEIVELKKELERVKTQKRPFIRFG